MCRFMHGSVVISLVKECVGPTDAGHNNKEYIDINRATIEIHSRNIGIHNFMGL